MWESGGLRYVQEIDCMNTGCPGHYETTNDYPGARYFGRGYIQLSWAYNYRAARFIYFYLDICDKTFLLLFLAWLCMET